MLPRSAASLTANLFILEFQIIKLIEPEWSQFISELKIVKCGEDYSRISRVPRSLQHREEMTAKHSLSI